MVKGAWEEQLRGVPFPKLGEGTAEQKPRLLPGLIDGTVTAAIGLDSRVQIKDGQADGEAVLG